MSEQKLPRERLVLGSAKGPDGAKLVRFSYFNGFEPRLNEQSGKMQRSIVLMVPKTNTEDVKAVTAAIDSLKKQVWLDAGKRLPPAFHNPLRDGDTALKQNGDPVDAIYHGHYFINATSDADKPLAIVGTTRGVDGKFVRLQKGQVKSGDWGRAGIVLAPYLKGNCGIGVYLSNVQMVREGDPLAGGTSAEQDFDGFDDDAFSEGGEF